jgi:4-hydroxybenzoate polyprenyltransferase
MKLVSKDSTGTHGGDDRTATQRLIPLARACHFQPTVAVTAFTTAMAVGAGRRWGAARVGSAVLAGQLAVGWSNDYLDRDRDQRAGRTDKPIPAGQVSAKLVRNCAIVAALGCVPLSLLSGWRAASVHGVAVGAAFGYNAFLKGTAASVVPYVVAFGALPAFVTIGGRPGHRPPLAATLAAALMGGGAHFINVLPDLEADSLTGVRGLPHRLGATGSLVLGTALLGSATAIVARASGAPLQPISQILVGSAATLVGGVLLAAVAKQRRTAWTLALGTSAATVALYLSRAGSLT